MRKQILKLRTAISWSCFGRGSIICRRRDWRSISVAGPAISVVGSRRCFRAGVSTLNRRFRRRCLPRPGKWTPDGAPVRYHEVRLPASPLGGYDMIFFQQPVAPSCRSGDAVVHDSRLGKPGVPGVRHGSAAVRMTVHKPNCSWSSMRPTSPPSCGMISLHSLLAAYDEAEITEQLCRAELSLCVEVVSDRHVVVWGDVG